MQLTDQSVFNAVAKAMADQGFRRSVNEGGLCMYRGTEGRRCAFGAVLPDELYEPRFDSRAEGSGGMTATQVLERSESVRDHFAGVSPFLLTELQQAHDHASTPARMKDALLDVGLQFKLAIPEELQ